MNAFTLVALAFLATPLDSVDVTIVPLRTEITPGEPLVLLVKVQNNGSAPVELSRRRTLSTVIFVREKGAEEFVYVARGVHYREGLEIDGTDSWAAGSSSAWDEWILRRCDPQGVTAGLVFEREGQFEVIIAARLDHSLTGGRGWRDSNVITLSVSNTHGTDSRLPATAIDETTRLILERGIRPKHRGDDLAAMLKLEGVLADYANFRIGESAHWFHYAGSLYDPAVRETFGEPATLASQGIEAYLKLSDRCPGLRRRAAFRSIGLLISYPQARASVDFDRLTESLHLAVPLPFHFYDQFNFRQAKSDLRRLQILFAPDQRLDTRIQGTFGEGITCRDFYDRVGKESGIRIFLPESTLDRPSSHVGNVDSVLRDLLYRQSTRETWWELRDGAVTIVQEVVAKPPLRP